MVFTGVFTVEMVLKLIAFKPKVSLRYALIRSSPQELSIMSFTFAVYYSKNKKNQHFPPLSIREIIIEV